MRLKDTAGRKRPGTNAFTFVEVVIAVLVVGLLMASLYGAFSFGFSVIQSSREDLRATQILVRRTEALRLYTWSQLLDTNYVSAGFSERYDPFGGTNNSGALYSGVVTLSVPTNLPAAYQTNMRTVNMTLYWTNYAGNRTILRTRSMETQVTRNGIQNYVWGGL